MPASPSALLIFQKNTIKGKVKTRLAAAIGEEEALEVYRTLLSHTYSEAAKLSHVDVVPFFSERLEGLPIPLPNISSCQIQQGELLGSRMSQAFEWAFSEGYSQVGIIGTDCPQILCEDIQRGFEQLAEHELCFGPAIDGGYYFLGMRRFYPWVFENINWSSEEVLHQSLESVKKNQRTYSLLRSLRDVDTVEDYLAFFKKK